MHASGVDVGEDAGADLLLAVGATSVVLPLGGHAHFAGEGDRLLFASFMLMVCPAGRAQRTM